jgi:hypothetical protein
VTLADKHALKVIETAENFHKEVNS